MAILDGDGAGRREFSGTLVAQEQVRVISLVLPVRVLRENCLDYVSLHVGQSPLDAVVIESEAAVVDSQEMQDGGMEVVPVDALVD